MFKVGNSQYTDLLTFNFRWLAVSPVTSLLQFSLLTYITLKLLHTHLLGKLSGIPGIVRTDKNEVRSFPFTGDCRDNNMSNCL